VLDNLQFMLSGQTITSRTYDKFEVQDRAIETFRQFATAKNVHITLGTHTSTPPSVCCTWSDPLFLW
jgi:twinkle protein